MIYRGQTADMTLDDETAEELLSVSRTTLGDDLRSLTYFTHDEYDHIYLRNNLERGGDPEAFVGNERRGFSSQRSYDWSELGEYKYTVRVFEVGYLVRVITDDHGVYATVDALSPDRLDEVVESIEDILRESATDD